MSQSIVYIAFGGNIGDSEWIFREAKAQLRSALGSLLGSSRLYRSVPMTDPLERIKGDPSPYLNAAASFETTLSPEKVLATCMEVERFHGRDRADGKRWMSRTLDLDIIAYDDLIIESPTLTVPHPGMHQRDFVLYPLADINPQFIHPVLKLSVIEMIETLPTSDGYVTEVEDTTW